MSREALHESLSAVMDNEADDLELRRVLSATGEGELRATWSRYQVARAAMHQELFDPHVNLAAAVSAAIAEDDVPVVAGKAKRGAWHNVGRVAVAASVTVAVLAGVRLYNQAETGAPQMAHQASPAPSSLTVPQAAQGPAMLAGYSEGEAAQVSTTAPVEAWHEQRLPEYVRQHAQAADGDNSGLPQANSTER